ncbi:decapping enzyme [Aspergillus sp. HF37]|nr:decapping enzyme [Aspergillus sp. HF37]
MQLEDWGGVLTEVDRTGLDDLCVRFIINLPREELESVERICFQVEEAQWFYEDFIRPLDPALPSLSLKAFALRIFQHCPLMSQWSHYHHITAFSEFLAYKTRVPVRGAIMLNQDMDEVVLVKGWKKGANWSFPRGKINKDEKDLDCAIREVYEETGFDIKDAGLVKDEKEVKYIEITMREQHMRLYVFRGVPQGSHFEPRTRKEISKIEWYKLSDLPTLKKSKQHDQGLAVANANKFYMVAPFLHPLKKWIAQQKRVDPKAPTDRKQAWQGEGEMSMDEAFQTDNSNLTPWQASGKMVRSSDLPEVTASHDASSHLKRLLSINNNVAPPDQLPPVNHLKDQDFNAGKSNALLSLLRGGSSHDAVPQRPNYDAPQMRTGPQEPQQAPSHFPGFPQHGQPIEQPGHLLQNPLFQRGPLPPHIQHPADAPPIDPNLLQRPLGQGERPGHPDRSDGNIQQHFPPRMPYMPPHQDGFQRSGPYHFPPTQSHAPAPFQRTGDPQFSHQAQPAQVQGAAVPPASKLPPPKLTNHSLALLNVLRDEPPKAPRAPDALEVPKAEKGPTERRRPSQQQDHLLNLLRGPNAAAQVPAELSGQSAPLPEKQILQRPQAVATTKQQGIRGSKSPVGEGQTSATISGPLNMPHFEGIGKIPGKKKANGNRKSNKDRQPQTPASPITILPRPQTAKGEPSPTKATARTAESPSQSPEAKSSEAQKPFQPKILRRPEKPQPDGPVRTKPSAELDAKVEANASRRPSQTPAQKEALLSLFGKQASPPSSSPAGPFNIETSAPKSAAASTSISPLSPVNHPPSGDGLVSGHDAQSPAGNRAASPANKAFLLGFLEGVAKGNQ